MKTDYFDFQQFRICHDRCAMKTGTDGVLLGAWAHGGGRMLDVGSGSGLIALMLAQRFPEALVEGVEVDSEAVAQSRENVARSPFAGRVTISEGPFQQLVPRSVFRAEKRTGSEGVAEGLQNADSQIVAGEASAVYDAIVSNPPYFLDGPAAPDAQRAVARHASQGFFHDFFSFTRRWLKAEGEVSLVLPMGSLDAVAMEAYLRGYRLSRLLRLRTVPRKPAERCLVGFARQRKGEAELGEEVLLAEDGKRSAWYQQLTRDFYLNADG